MQDRYRSKVGSVVMTVVESELTAALGLKYLLSVSVFSARSTRGVGLAGAVRLCVNQDDDTVKQHG